MSSMTGHAITSIMTEIKASLRARSPKGDFQTVVLSESASLMKMFLEKFWKNCITLRYLNT